MKAALPTLFVAVALALSPKASADFTSNQLADVVLGQLNFTTGTAVNGQPNRFFTPYSMALDPTTGKVFVADTGNNRILRFSSTAAAQSGSNPEAVLGQGNFSDFASNQGGAAASNTLSVPKDVYVDSSGRLWVADSGNNRVLRFDLASFLSNNAPASAVLGQPNFTTVAAGTTQAKMSSPYGIYLDSAGVLWVADSSNNRVLRFDAAATLASGTNASGVLGQATFITAVAATSATGMSDPKSVTADTAGRLWVADKDNNRVLRFDAAAGLANGAAASAVLGQPDFITPGGATSSTKMFGPYGVFLDSSTGNLWVSEYFNRRAIRFNSAASLASGAAASLVLGQPDFTTFAFATTQRGGGGLIHVAAGPNGSLLVADYDNSRVLRYSPSATPSPNPRPPLLSLIGPVRRTTSAASLHVRGLSGDPDGVVTSVQGRVGTSAFTAARGTSPWNFHARGLRPGVNRVQIRATDNDGLRSAILRVTIIRSN
jgi:sugar lactone lactonase YvrE